MRSISFSKVLFGIVLGLIFAGEAVTAPVPVYVSIAPQAYFAEKIGGQRVDVHVLVGPGKNLHTFEPTPRQMATLAESRLYFTIGVPLEKHLIHRLAKTDSGPTLVDSITGIPRRPLEESAIEHPTHQKESAHVHHHDAGDRDPHVWLNPRLARRIAHNMAEALIAHDPENADFYRANLDTLAADLEQVDRCISQLLKPLAGSKVFVYHPAFGYFTDAYGLRQVPVELGGRQPSPRELTHLIETARRENMRVLFVQPQFSRRSAETIARAIGGEVVPIDPLARDYLVNLERIAGAIHDALSPEP